MGVFSSIAQWFTGPRPLLPPGQPAQSRRRQASPPPRSKFEYHLEDLAAAVMSADTGNLMLAGRLAAACRRDGVIAGVLGTRTKGLLCLPRKISAPDPQVAKDFAAVFDYMFPLSEQEQLLGDGILLGVGVAEFVQETWARLPSLRRLDPERLVYRWSEDAWYYNGANGAEQVKPGDGRWVLYRPGGHVAPWRSGNWQALGRAYIVKQTSFYLRENYANNLANAARVIESPAGATKEDREEQLDQVADWGVSPCFDLPPGYKINLIESNGNGFEVYSSIIESSDRESVVNLSGQTVTLDGGAGFQNGAIFSAIRSDLIKSDSTTLAETLVSQGAYVWGYLTGVDGSSIKLEWDITPPKDRTQEAAASLTAAQAAKAWVEAGAKVDIDELAKSFGVPIKADPAPEVWAPKEQDSPSVGQETSVLFEDSATDDFAQKMTEHSVERCPHGNNNRCPKCGIERVSFFSS